jgi:Uma2 family endonuclease
VLLSAYVRLPPTPSRAYAMGMPAHQHTEWTVEMVHELPDDGNRYEVIDGELLVSPAPSFLHQRAILQLYRILFPYVASIGQEALLAPAAVRFSKRREVQPDLLVLPLKDGRPVERFEDVGVLTLAVEALSPSSIRADRYLKRQLYQDERVPEYWIVDADTRIIERWRPDNEESEVLSTTLLWQPLASRDPLAIDLTTYFRAVHAD